MFSMFFKGLCSPTKLLVMLVLLLCSIGIKKQRYWCFCFWLVTFPTKLVGSLISLHLSFVCVSYSATIPISCTLFAGYMPLLFFHYGLQVMLVSLLSSEVSFDYFIFFYLISFYYLLSVQ